MDYELNNQYFRQKAVARLVWIVVAGAVMAFAGILFLAFITAVGITLFVGGLAVLFWGIGLIVVTKRAQVSYKSYDASAKNCIRQTERLAEAKLGINKSMTCELTPLLFFSYVMDGADKMRMERDGTLRTNKAQISKVFFLNEDVRCYSVIYDTCDENVSPVEKCNIIPYSRITDAKFERGYFSLERVNARNYYCRTFTIRQLGAEACVVHIEDDFSSDAVSENINLLISRKKKELQQA